MTSKFARHANPPPYTFSSSSGDLLLGVFLNQNANHVGLIYVEHTKDKDGKSVYTTKYFHFYSKKIANAEVEWAKIGNKQFFYTSASVLDRFTAIGFCAYLSSVASKNPTIKYGLDWKGAKGSFNKQGFYSPPEGSNGLSCATFLSEIFAGHGLALVKDSDWPENKKQERDWRDGVVKRARETLADGRGSLTEEDIQDMANVDPLIRLRPVHVAAALATPSVPRKPMNYADAREIARTIVNDFKAAYPAATVDIEPEDDEDDEDNNAGVPLKV